jgi:chromate transporter
MMQLARYFLYLGATGFGGPLVLIQLMRQQYVDKEQRMTGVEFDQVFALVKAMPGPVAFQMAVFLGQRFFGFKGGAVAGFCLLLPAFILMLLAGLFYTKFMQIDAVNTVMRGFLYAASAVILFSLKNLISTNKNFFLFWVFLVINLLLFWFHILPEPALIVLFGLLMVALDQWKPTAQLMSVSFLLVDLEKTLQIFKTCAYAGAFVFGTGFALIPVLKTNLVDLHPFLSLKEFNDAVIFGQMTPGPITISTAFMGYQMSGFIGALAATLGVFCFPFIHMVTWFPKAIGWLTKQSWIIPFVRGATSAVVAGIVITVIQMNLESYVHASFWIVFLATASCLYFRPKTSVIGIFITAGLAEYLLSMVMS